MVGKWPRNTVVFEVLIATQIAIVWKMPLGKVHEMSIILSTIFCLIPCDGKKFTLPETNIAPENGWLEDVFPIEIVPF